MARTPAHRYPRPIRTGLADQVVEHLMNDIATGIYGAGSKLPPEAELAAQAGVSRLTLREAVTSLRQRGIVRVEQGRGTFVNPTSQWISFDPMMLAKMVDGDRTMGLAQQLTEVRTIVEVGAADLAARRRTREQLAEMRAAIDSMRAADEIRDSVQFSAADIEFHRIVLRSAGNEFVSALLAPVDAGLREVRIKTSQERWMNDRAIQMHTQIYEAIRKRSPRTAANTMSRHLKETQDYIAELAKRASSETS